MPAPSTRPTLAVALTGVLVIACASAPGVAVPSVASRSSPTQTTNAADAPPTANASDSAYADSVAAQTFASLDVPALYVGIWDPQRGSFIHAYGNAVRDGVGATTADSFRVASITKTFTATAVLELVEEGKIDISSPATNYLSAPLSQDATLARINVAQLLGMQSGLADYLTDPNGIATQIAADPTRAWAPEELVRAALELGSSAPGTGGYSNTNFVLLGLIAEHVTGTSLQALIGERLTAPLNMSDTFLPSSADTTMPEPQAHGYLNQACVDKAASAGAPNVDVETDTTAWNTSYFYGAGGMVSTLADLGVWAATDLGTDLLGSQSAAERVEMHDIGGYGFRYGLGLKQFGNWYGHDGDAFGWDSLALHDPSTGVSYVAVVNACTGYNDALLDLIQTLYPDQPTRS
jgi:D-alanyl-D-alanine carboxypeptidase